MIENMIDMIEVGQDGENGGQDGDRDEHVKSSDSTYD